MGSGDGELDDGAGGRPRQVATERDGPLDAHPGELAAGTAVGGDERALALEGHGVRDEPPADGQRLPRPLEDVLVEPAADEDGVGSGEGGEIGSRRVADDDLDAPGQPEGGGVVADALGSGGVALDAGRARPLRGEAPLEGDRAVAGTEVPQVGTGGGAQPGQGRGPHVTLGQLAVVGDEVLGATGHGSRGRRDRGGVVGAHLDAAEHEVVGPTGEGVGPLAAGSLVRPAEVPTCGERARAPAALREQGAETRGVGAVGAEDDEPGGGGEMGQDRAQVAPDRRDDRRALRGPALARPREGVAAHRRVDPHGVGPEQVDQRRRDAGAQRVAAREGDGVARRPQELGQTGAKGARPGDELGAGCVGSQEVEVAAPADEGRRTRDEAATRPVQAVPPVVTDTHDLDHGRPP